MISKTNFEKITQLLDPSQGPLDWENICLKISEEPTEIQSTISLWARYVIFHILDKTGAQNTILDDVALEPINPRHSEEIRNWVAENIIFCKKVINTIHQSPERSHNDRNKPKPNASPLVQISFYDLTVTQIEFLSSPIRYSEISPKAKKKLAAIDIERLGQISKVTPNELIRKPGIGKNTVKEIDQYLKQYDINMGSIVDWPKENDLIQFLSDQDLSSLTFFQKLITGHKTIEDEISSVLIDSLSDEDAKFLSNRYGLNDHHLMYTYEELATTDHFSEPVTRQRVQQIIAKLESLISDNIFINEVIDKAINNLNLLDVCSVSEADEHLKNSGFTKTDHGFKLLEIASKLGITSLNLQTHFSDYLNLELFVTGPQGMEIIEEIEEIGKSLHGEVFVDVREYLFIANPSETRFIANSKIISFDDNVFLTRIPDSFNSKGHSLFNFLAKIFSVFKKVNFQDLLAVILDSRTVNIDISTDFLLNFLDHIPFITNTENVVVCNEPPIRRKVTETEAIIISKFLEFGEVIDAHTIKDALLQNGSPSGTIAQVLMFCPFIKKISRGNRTEAAKYTLIGDIEDLLSLEKTDFTNETSIFKIDNTIYTKTIGEFQMDAEYIPNGTYSLLLKDGTKISNIEVSGKIIRNLSGVMRSLSKPFIEIEYHSNDKLFSEV